jgi:hypothetical protein
MYIDRGSDMLSAAKLDVQPMLPIDTPVTLVREVWQDNQWECFARLFDGVVTGNTAAGLDESMRAIMPDTKLPVASEFSSRHPLTFSVAPEWCDAPSGLSALTRLALHPIDRVSEAAE